MHFIQQHLPILQWLPGYKRSQFKGDFFAGLTVGVMLVPQGMAYAMIAGLPPVYGLYASIVPQVVYAIFGTSRQLSVGPVAMDSLMVAAGVSVLAIEGTEMYIGFAILLAFFMGLFQVLLGFFRMGFITNLLSKPVISGFTSAAAIIIGVNQLQHLIGTEIAKSNQIYGAVWNTFQKLDEVHLITLVIGIAGILVIQVLKHIHKAIPGSLVVIGLGISIVCTFNLENTGVQLVQSISGGLPEFKIPQFELGQLQELIPLAMTISIVSFMEAYSVAKALESKRKDHKVDANQELVGLGFANLVGSLFQAYPVTGGFSRTAVNDQSGAQTPIASVISAILVALVLLFLTPLFYFLPKAVLASVIMVAVIGLIDFAYIRTLWRQSKLEFSLLMVTFLVTLNFSMVLGIITGVLFSILILLFRYAYPHIATLGRLKGSSEFRNVKRFKDLEIWKEKLILRIDAPLSFINIQYIRDHLFEQLERQEESIKEVIIDASAISYVDATATEGLSDIIEKLEGKGIRLVLTEVIGPVRDSLFKTGRLQKISVQNIYLTLNDAMENRSAPYENRNKAIQHGFVKGDNDQ